MDTRPDHITPARACACGVMSRYVLYVIVSKSSGVKYVFYRSYLCYSMLQFLVFITEETRKEEIFV